MWTTVALGMVVQIKDFGFIANIKEATTFPDLYLGDVISRFVSDSLVPFSL